MQWQGKNVDASIEGLAELQKLLILTEGVHDIQFLRHAGRMLRTLDPQLPDLDQLESAGRLLFLPLGGGGACTWVRRFESLRCRECYILDRETMPQTLEREHAAECINRRAGARAFLTKKRGIENYFHSAAISESLGVEVDCGDDNDVAAAVAEQLLHRSQSKATWQSLSPHDRKRRRDRVKRILHARSLDHMTASRIGERDVHDEIRTWLLVIRSLSEN